MGRKRGLYPACLRIAHRTARVKKGAARPGYLCDLGFWGATTWKRPAYDEWSQDGAWGKRAQLDQGQYRAIDSGSCDEVKRLSYDVVEEQRVLNLRPSCLESYAVGMGHGQSISRTPAVVSRGRSAGRTSATVSSGRRAYHSNHQTVLRAKGLITPPWQQFPRGRPSGEQGSILLVYPGLREGPPGF